MEEPSAGKTKSKVDITIIVPVLNEAESLPLLYEQLKRILIGMSRTYEIIFVNDGSTDGSEGILNALAEKDPQVRVIHLRTNYGQTAAIAAGLDYSRGEIIIPMDADLQNDPQDIPRLVEKLEEGYDVVSGWRKNRQDKAVSRILPSLIANKLISLISGVRL
ncbi:MAG: glycosyltransferase family 2 protein, partial [Candidatus Sumerlaeia bacterium]|nr:glycosyltransferase family 2 protein [Candidatus Sumerlaeia bacterium]